MNHPNFEHREGAPRSALKRQLYQLIVARSDITAAHRLVCMMLDSNEKDEHAFIGHDLYPAYFYSIVVSYARPFTDIGEMGSLPKKWSRFPQQHLKQTHGLVLETRHKVVAHSDPIKHSIKIVPPDFGGFESIEPPEHIGLEISRDDYFGRRTFEQVRELCRYQLVELHHGIDDMLERLYGGMELPTVPFPLRLDEGL